MKRRVLAAIGLSALAVLLFLGGVVFAQSRWTTAAWQPGWMMGQAGASQSGPGMMNNWNGMNGSPGVMNGNTMGGSMMNGGMMNGGMMGGGMMGNWGGLAAVDPLSTEAAQAALDNYLATLDKDNLVPGEIMIFENHAYAQIRDESTGRGAFEVLIDPASGNVFPEPGPNMMWNTEYGMMTNSGGWGMMNGGMMGGNMMGALSSVPDGDSDVTAAEAVNIAQEYLDATLPGTTADEHADAFPGYYTLHVLKEGEVIGMLSVHATSGQVFLHHWHGDFVEMVGPDHD